MSRRKRNRDDWPFSRYREMERAGEKRGRVTERKTDRAPAPEVSEHEKFRRSLLDLVGEMREQASGATMGASLLRRREAHHGAALFLEGLASGLSTMIERVSSALDEDEIPF